MRIGEAMARTLSKGDLRQSPIEEAGSDRVAALGRADSLGAALWRVLAEHDRGSVLTAGLLLAKRIRRGHESRDFLLKICAAVIHEWLADKCRKCGGRGFVITGEVKHACTTCLGLGNRRHSDTERMRALNVDRRIYTKWEPRFAEAHAALADALSRVKRQTSAQLERGRI